MDGADWKKLLIFGSLGGLTTWGFKWSLKKLETLELEKKKIRQQKTPYTVTSLLEKKAALSTAGEIAMVQGTCLDMGTVSMKVEEDVFKSIKPNYKLYSV